MLASCLQSLGDRWWRRELHAALHRWQHRRRQQRMVPWDERLQGAVTVDVDVDVVAERFHLLLDRWQRRKLHAALHRWQHRRGLFPLLACVLNGRVQRVVPRQERLEGAITVHVHVDVVVAERFHLLLDGRQRHKLHAAVDRWQHWCRPNVNVYVIVAERFELLFDRW